MTIHNTAINDSNTEYIQFVKKIRGYLGDPSPAPIGTRSDVRDDLVIASIADLLNGSDPITILDVCCGHAALVKHIARSFEKQLGRINYIGVDCERTFIEQAKRDNRPEQQKFQRLDFKTRDAADIDHQLIGEHGCDIIVFANSLHEIAPREYLQLFSSFNTLLIPDHGMIHLIDMDTALPVDEPECRAIIWTTDEVTRIMEAGGWQVTPTSHSKTRANVLSLKLGYLEQINADAFQNTIASLLKTKLVAALQCRDQLPPSGSNDLIYDFTVLLDWIVRTGTIARLTEEVVYFRAIEEAVLS